VGSNILAKPDEFKVALEAKIRALGLMPKEVANCIPMIYHDLSQSAHGDTGFIAVSGDCDSATHQAVLATILKVQNAWSDPLEWEEVEPKQEM